MLLVHQQIITFLDQFMDISRYHVKHFWLEYLGVAVQLLPYTLETSFTTVTILTVLINIMKQRTQGMRMNFLVLVLSHIMYALGLTSLHILLMGAYIYTLYLFRVYDVPQSKGNIGYRKMQLGHASFELFYPTDDRVGRVEIPLFEKGVWNKMFDIVNKDNRKPSKIPRWVMYFSTHYYTKMMMNDIYPGAKPRPGGYEVIVLSHQLGLNSLYTYAREFADEGYFVCSLIHTEEIRNLLPGLESNRPQRMSQLAQRTTDVKRALDFLCNKDEFTGAFGEDVKLDYSKVHIMGHSFGGSTSLKTAADDQRITGVVVAMDPCMYILHEDRSYDLNKNTSNNKTLILLAEDYYEIHYPTFENDYRANIMRQNSPAGSVLAFRLMGSNHASFSEMALMCEGQFRAFKVLRDNGNTRFYLQLTLCMIRLLLSHPNLKNEQEFCNLMMSQNPKENQNIKTLARPLVHQQEKRRHRQYHESKKNN